MTARVLQFPFRAEAPVHRETRLATAQRSWLAVEDALAGDWSDSCLIAAMVTAGYAERRELIAERERRAHRCKASAL